MPRVVIPPDTPWFHYYNANPENKRVGDCVVRAICTATGQSWQETLSALCGYAIRLSTMPNSKDCYPQYLKDLGWVKMKQPKKANGKKLKGWEFARAFSGVAICHIGAQHIVCVRGGRIWDTWDSSGRCIGSFWVPPQD